MAENHFGNPQLVFGVLGDIDTVAVVRHADGSVNGGAGDVETSYGQCVGLSVCNGLCLPNHVIAHIHNAFIEQLVQPGNICELPSYHCCADGDTTSNTRIIDACERYVIKRFARLDGSNIRIWFF